MSIFANDKHTTLCKNIFNVKKNLNMLELRINKKRQIIDKKFNLDMGEYMTPIYTNDSDVKIIVCTCIYKRKSLTRFCLNEWLNSPIYMIVCCYSEDDDYNNIKDMVSDRLYLCKYTNLPLSNKWNYCVNQAKQFNPDAVMIVGSDDIFTNKYIESAQYNINRGVEYISNNNWLYYFYYKKNIMIMNFKYLKRPYNDGLGSGRIYAKKILDIINWDLYKFETPINKCLDGTSFTKVKEYIKIQRFDIIPNAIILLKNTDDSTGISVKNNYYDYINKHYRAHNSTTIDHVNMCEVQFKKKLASF